MIVASRRAGAQELGYSVASGSVAHWLLDFLCYFFCRAHVFRCSYGCFLHLPQLSNTLSVIPAVVFRSFQALLTCSFPQLHGFAHIPSADSAVGMLEVAALDAHAPLSSVPFRFHVCCPPRSCWAPLRWPLSAHGHTQLDLPPSPARSCHVVAPCPCSC